MIQVLGLRSHVTPDGKERKREVFFAKGWRFASVDEVLSSAPRAKVLASIPEAERYNLFFTVADCFEETGRKLREQWVVPFDIDDIDTSGDIPNEVDNVARVVCKAIGVSFEKTGVIFSGNGVQIFVKMEAPIIDEMFFDRNREGYALLIKRIGLALREENLKGTPDPSVWSKARLMRMPDTINRKPNRPERTAYVVQANLEAQVFDVADFAPKKVEVDAYIPNEIIKNYPKPDTQTILSDCHFLSWCKEKPAEVSEPQWYAMVSITSRLDNGRNITHEYSEGHPGYSHFETENKIEQALASAGPRTCKNIETLWQGCENCTHYQKIASPILIRSDSFIASKDFGFRERIISEKGVKAGKPVFRDLINFFKQEAPFKTVLDTGHVIRFDGKKWVRVYEREINNWMTKHVNPEPSVAEMSEFLERLKNDSPVNKFEMGASIADKLNFQNGVLDLKTGELHAHASSFLFTNILPYAYDQHAACPTWDRFISEVCQSNSDKIRTLEEFAGYCISGDDYWYHKALILIGDGANGKSVFASTLASLVGMDNASNISVKQLSQPTMAYSLYGKMMNYSDETDVRSFDNSSVFKTASSGGTMVAKKLYEQEFAFNNKAKLLLLCNEMPIISDLSYGFKRRLLIVRMTATFNRETPGFDPRIASKLQGELPGICNKLTKAYNRFKERGYMEMEGQSDAILAQHMENHDSVMQFLEERMEADQEAKTKNREIYMEYARYCRDVEEKPRSAVWFFRKLYETYTRAEPLRSGGIKYVIGVKLRKDF